MFVYYKLYWHQIDSFADEFSSYSKTDFAEHSLKDKPITVTIMITIPPEVDEDLNGIEVIMLKLRLLNKLKSKEYLSYQRIKIR